MHCIRFYVFSWYTVIFHCHIKGAKKADRTHEEPQTKKRDQLASLFVLAGLDRRIRIGGTVL